MRWDEKALAKIFAAVLPVMALTAQFSDAWRTGAAVCAIFWITAGFFKLTWPLFPRWLLGFTMVLFLLFLGSIVWGLTHLTPYGLASVYLLGPLEFGEKKKTDPSSGKSGRGKIISHRFSGIFWKGIVFFLLLMVMGAIQDFLGGRFQVSFFRSPAGPLFLLGVLAAVCWSGTSMSRVPMKGH